MSLRSGWEQAIDLLHDTFGEDYCIVDRAALNAGEGLVLSIWQSFRAARMLAAMGKTRLRPSSIGAQ